MQSVTGAVGGGAVWAWWENINVGGFHLWVLSNLPQVQTKHWFHHRPQVNTRLVPLLGRNMVSFGVETFSGESCQRPGCFQSGAFSAKEWTFEGGGTGKPACCALGDRGSWTRDAFVLSFVFVDLPFPSFQVGVWNYKTKNCKAYQFPTQPKFFQSLLAATWFRSSCVNLCQNLCLLLTEMESLMCKAGVPLKNAFIGQGENLSDMLSTSIAGHFSDKIGRSATSESAWRSVWFRFPGECGCSSVWDATNCFVWYLSSLGSLCQLFHF